MLGFEEGGKPENPEKNRRSKGENQQQTQSTYDAGSGNRAQDTLVEGERSYHNAAPAPLKNIHCYAESYGCKVIVWASVTVNLLLL